MPDIFLSYNRENQATARRFAEAFQAEGLEVWWDTTLKAGEAYDQVTEKALKTAKAVVVLWSKQSVDSRWVRAEATLADRNKTLVPVTIEPCERPIMFELTQTAELSHWEGDVRDGAWQAFMADLKRFVQSARSAPLAELEASRSLTQPPVRAAGRLSICVLPFANMSRDEDQEYFADGISEDIITDLSKVAALSVIARNTAFRFKGMSIDVPQVARQLGVTHVLEGSVRKAGNRVRITAQLIDGKAGDHIWADRWDRDLDDIFALQDEISEAIVGALKLRLAPEEKKAIEDRGTSNVEAYDIYLRARALANQLNLDRAIDLHRRALSLDPNFVHGWSALNFALTLALTFAPARRADLSQQMREAVERMIALAPDAPAGHLAAVGQLMLRGEFLSADQHLRQLQASHGGWSAELRQSRRFLDDSVGRFSDAIDGQREAVHNDPLSLVLSLVHQQLLDIVGRTDEAWAEYERSKDLPGDRQIVEFFSFLRMWGAAKPEDVQAQYRRMLACDPTTPRHSILVQLADVLGDPTAACNFVCDAFNSDAEGGRVYLMLMAGLLGDSEVALGAMRRDYVERKSLPMRPIWMPALAEARRDPRFKEIVRDLGLVEYWRQTGRWADLVRPVGDDDFEVVG